MPVNVQKGGKICINKEDPKIRKAHIGVGWEFVAGKSFDLDVLAFGCDRDDHVIDDEWCVFFNNLRSPDGAIRHSGDNRTGAGEGDDEVILIDLDKVDRRVEKINVAVTIYKGSENGQNFGMLKDAFIRIVNQETNGEIINFDLDERSSIHTGMVLGCIERDRFNNWYFTAVAEGYRGNSILEIMKKFGVNVG